MYDFNSDSYKPSQVVQREKPESLRITILNVGHADSIYVETPYGNNILIDCGNGKSGSISPTEFLKNINCIDELQISHPDTDHFNDISGICNKRIRSFACPGLNLFPNDSDIDWRLKPKKSGRISNNDYFAELRRRSLLREARENIKILRNYQKEPGCVEDIVYCDSIFNYEKCIYEFDSNEIINDANITSIVTILTYHNIKILLGGDLPKKMWEKLLQYQNFRKMISETTIFKVSHHGKQDGQSEELLKIIHPHLCIISGPNKISSKDIEWYEARSKGLNIKTGLSYTDEEKNKVLLTGRDGSVFIEIENDGNLFVYKNWTRKRRIY